MNTNSVMEAVELRDAIATGLWKYCSPIILLVGTIGNVLTVVVIGKGNTKRVKIRVHLIALAISDTVMLYFGLLREWLYHSYNIDIRQSSNIACKLLTWIVYTYSHFSSWIVVIITVERFVSIYFPMYTWSKSTKHVVPLLRLLSVLTFFTILNAHYLYGQGKVRETHQNNTLVTERCYHLHEQYSSFILNFWIWVDFSFFCFIPLGILLPCNAAMVHRLRAEEKSLQNSKNVRAIEFSGSRTVNLKIIVFLNSAFALTVLPVCAYLLTVSLYEKPITDDLKIANFHVAYAVASNLMYCGNAVNFFLYMLSGRLLRNEFFGLFQKKQRRSRAATAAPFIVIAE